MNKNIFSNERKERCATQMAANQQSNNYFCAKIKLITKIFYSFWLKFLHLSKLYKVFIEFNSK